MGALQLALILCISCLVDDTFASRRYSKTLRVTNGGPWGGWNLEQFCRRGSYAIGYNMKIEEKCGDDTSLNGVQLICGDIWGLADGSTATSGSGPWGNWRGEKSCTYGEVITGFRLQVERPQGRGDDTAANYMQVRCRKFSTFDEGHVRYHGNGYGYWGSYGSWSESCAANTAVCGIRTKIEAPQGRGDDTALNDIELFCCPQD